MTTIAAGNHQQIYFDHLDDIVITPGSGGTVNFDCSTPNSAATRPTARIIYSETVISIPAGSTVFLDAVGADATYDRYTHPSLSSLESAYPASSNAGNSEMVGGLIYDAFSGAWRLRGSASGLPVYSWKDRPDPTTYVGDVIFRDIGVRGSRWTSDGLYWAPFGGNPIVLDVQNFDVSYTDDRTTEQVLYEYHLPPGLIRENYAVEVMAKNTWGAFATGVTRSLRFYVGSAQLGATNNGAATVLTSTKWHGFSFENKNALGSQIGEANGYAGVAAQQSSVGFTTSTADSTKYITLQIRGIITTLGAGTMTNALNAVRLTLIPGY